MTDSSKSLLTSSSDQTSLQRWVMRCVVLGTGTVSINNSSFNPAIPELMHDFSVSEATVSWVVVIFLLTMSLSLLITGFVSQRFGKKRVYLSALTVFMLSSIFGVFAPNFETILTVRALQGFASGLMIPLSLGIIFSVTPQNQRGAATGIWGAMIMLTLACGPMLGSLILLFSDWKGLFLLNIPFSVASLILGWKFLPKENITVKNNKFDWSGFSFISISIVSLLLGISSIKQLQDLQNAFFLVMLSMSLVSIFLFIFSSKSKSNTLISKELFKSPSFNYSLFISISHTVCLFICLLIIPLLIQNALGMSPVWTGILLMVSALVTSLCSKSAGKYLDKYGARHLIGVGLILTGISFIGLAFSVDESVYVLMLFMIIHGLGFGLSYLPSTTAGLTYLENQELVTQGAAINNLLRRVAAAVAVVIAAIYLELRTEHLSIALEHSTAQLQAIRELFLMCAAMILVTYPYAFKFPSIAQQAKTL